MKAKARVCGAAVALGALVVLPAAAEDGYVESLGKQFVNLRAFKTANTRVWIDFQTTYEFDVNYHYIFGTDGSKTGSHFSFYVDSNGHFYFKFGEEATYVKAAPYDTQRHTMDIALNADGKGTHRLVFTTGSETVLDTTSTAKCSETTQHCPLMLFGQGFDYSNGEYANATIKMKVYGVKIWEGTTLTHDYVPRKVEGKYYLKDLVDGKYVTGVARADGKAMDELLTGGGDIVEEPGDAYIESHAHEQIDLGVKADGTTRVELDHQLVNIGGEAYFFGSRSTDGSLTFWSYYAGSGTKLGYECVDGGPRWLYFDHTGVKTGIAPAELRRTLVIDAVADKAAYETAGYECSALKIDGVHTKETQENLGLFNARAGTGWGAAVAMKFYGMNVYKNGALVKSFRPYVKNALPGVVDQDGNFLTSTGDASFRTNEMFRIGGAITGDAGMNDVFLETTGRECFDSGWTPTQNGKIVMDFAVLDVNQKDVFLLGCRDAGSGPYLWAGMANGKIAFAKGGTSWQYVVNDNVLNRGRYELTIDVASRSATLRQGGAVVGTKVISEDAIPISPVAIMGLYYEGDRLTGHPKIRLYSCAFYEGESRVHAFYPQKDENGGIGLYDREQKTYAKLLTTMSANCRILGKTVDGADLGFDARPPEKVSVWRGESVTLTASAPFATSYVWRRDGVVIEGATEPSYTVEAVKGLKTSTFSVAPVYTVSPIVGCGDRAVEGDEAKTEVTVLCGMSIIIR